jgi:hypothetical protein
VGDDAGRDRARRLFADLVVEVAPDEQDLAAPMFDAALAGDDLVQQRSQGSGGVAAFGPAEILMVPALLHALRGSAPVVMPFLTGAAAAAPTAVRALVDTDALHQIVQRRRRAAVKPSIHDDATPTEQMSPAGLVTVIDALTTALHASGLDDATCDRTALSCVGALLRSPDDGIVLVDAVAKRAS